MVTLFFCTRKFGWGFDNFLKEVNTGEGVKFSAYLRLYSSYIIPLIILAIFVYEYLNKFVLK